MKSIKTSKLVVIMLAMVMMVPAFGSIVTKAANNVDKAWSFSLQANSGV